MTTGKASNGIEARVSEWRALVRRGGIPESELEERESLLRGEAAALEEAGLDPDEAFLVAVKRIGSVDPAVGQVRPGGCRRPVEATRRRPRRGCDPDRSRGDRGRPRAGRRGRRGNEGTRAVRLLDVRGTAKASTPATSAFWR